MPHLPPITVNGTGSVVVAFAAAEHGTPPSNRMIRFATDFLPETSSRPPTTIEVYKDKDHEARIFLIEILGTAGSTLHAFAPTDGVCQVRIHYVLSSELAEIPAELDAVRATGITVTNLP